MKIILGTTSVDKLNYLLSSTQNTNIEQIAADSEISDQPLSIKETISGAQNRARNSYSIKYNLSIGMEGGLVMIDGVYNLVCVTSIFDGKNFFTGISKTTPLPKEVSDSIKDGLEFGDLIRSYEKNNPNVNVSELVTRKNSFIESIRKAFDLIES